MHHQGPKSPLSVRVCRPVEPRWLQWAQGPPGSLLSPLSSAPTVHEVCRHPSPGVSVGEQLFQNRAPSSGRGRPGPRGCGLPAALTPCGWAAVLSWRDED